MAISKYKNLVIIGNGFDRWQELPTAYNDFLIYYTNHIDELMNTLNIEKQIIISDEGIEKAITPVDLVYGNPFNPSKLPSEFFWNFEASLDKIDDQLLNLYCGRSEKGVSTLKLLVTQAQTILQKLFSGWILKLNIAPMSGLQHFGDDCFFVNFNYTDTLQKRFGINKQSIFYIHGEAENSASIIFGHSTHPETAFKELIEHHFMTPLEPKNKLPRFEGLYAIEDALYHTDKHVADNIDLMCKAFMQKGLHIEDIENIYVLGHSFGEPDIEYFDYINKITRCGCNFDLLSAAEKFDKAKLQQIMASDGYEDYMMREIQLNILYASHHRERTFGKPPVSFPRIEEMEKAVFGTENSYDGKTESEAAHSVHQRFLFEQSARTQEILKEIAREHGLQEIPFGCHSVLGLSNYLDGWHEPRKRNAQWHISFFSPDGKKQIERAMKNIGAKRYNTYEGIDKCLEAYERNLGNRQPMVAKV